MSKNLLEILAQQQERNVRKIESVRSGKYGKGIEGWYIINEDLEGIIPNEIWEEAIRLRKEEDDLILKCQTEAFNSYEQVREFNDRYGKTFVQYDPLLGFIVNCRKGFRPSPKGPTLYLYPEAEDEIANEAIKQFESTHVIPILTKLNELYDQAIEHIKMEEF